MKKDRILIEKENIPYRFSIALPSAVFDFEIRYNEAADLFTIGLYKNNTLLCIEPIVYGVPLFSQLYQPGVFPAVTIVPKDSSGGSTRVTKSNLNVTVFLEIENTGDEA